MSKKSSFKYGVFLLFLHFLHRSLLFYLFFMVTTFMMRAFSSAVDPSHSLKSTCQSSHDSWTRHCQSVWIINKKYTSALQFPSQGSIQFISSLPPQRTAPSSLMAGHCRVTGKFARLSGRCGLTPDPWPLHSLFPGKKLFGPLKTRKIK